MDERVELRIENQEEQTSAAEQPAGVVARRRPRIWELDALRGVATLVMIFDLVSSFLYRIFALVWSGDVSLVRAINAIETFRSSDVGSALRMIFCALIFILIAGINTVSSRHNVRRGLFYLILGTLITAAGYLVKRFTGYDFAIRFGILQFLGVSILLGQLLRPLKLSWLLSLGTLTLVVGYLNAYVEFDESFILPIFNYATPNPTAAETFPIVPYLGYFLFGMVLGKVFYASRVTLFPKGNVRKIRALTWLGEHSFAFYFWIVAVSQPALWMTCAIFA